MQDLNAMDEDVMVIRRKEIEEAARKQRRENLRETLGRFDMERSTIEKLAKKYECK